MEITSKDRLSGGILYNISKMVERTCRYQIVGIERFRKAFSSEKPVVVAAWHGMTMMIIPFAKKKIDIANVLSLMPDDWRGTALKVFTDHLGAQPFPMNLHGDSTMSQGRELIKIVRKVKEGNHLYYTPDGPDGPSYIIKPGLTYIAQKTNALILPVGAYCRDGFVVPRWDRYVIPYPFSRISVHIGEAYEISSKEKDLESENQKLTNLLHRVTLQAAANYYEVAVDSRE